MLPPIKSIKRTKGKNRITKIAHAACASTVQNIIYYSVPDVVEKERMGHQVDQANYCPCALGPVASTPKSLIFCFIDIGTMISISLGCGGH